MPVVADPFAGHGLQARARSASRTRLTHAKVYRGTQRTEIEGVRQGLSFAYSLPVAIIWSARPGDIWTGRQPEFLPTSTVHMATVAARNPLNLGNETYCTLGTVLRALGYPKGISNEDVRKIYTYLHNRIIGKAKGGAFSYVVMDPDGQEYSEYDVPLSFNKPESLISYFARESWDDAPELASADLLAADVYAFVDAPAVQRAALARGHDVIIYADVFAGGEDAATQLLGCDVNELDGVEEAVDLKGEIVPAHHTVRLLDPAAITAIEATPTATLLGRRYC